MQSELQRWQTAGLLTTEQATAILAFESGRQPEDREAREGATAVEVLAYLGAVVALAGVLILLGTRYLDLGTAGRLGVPGLVTLAALGAAILFDRKVEGAAGRRARSAALGLAVISLAGFVFQLQVEPVGSRLNPAPTRAVLISALLGSAVAAGLTAWTGAGLLALLLAVCVYVSGGAFLALRAGIFDPWPIMGVYAACGALLIIAAEFARHLRQRWPPEVLAFASLVMPSIAAYILPRSNQDLALELLGGLIALAAFGAAVLRSSAGYAIAGAVGVFGFVLMVELRHFQNSLGVPLILITSGLALLGIAYLTARLLPRLSGRSATGAVAGG